ncbi:hypothetical protein [Bacillus sp. Au-Bac7]|nr:hypothetical protein [Bacillus sp. Au-Bac7]
MTKYTSDIKLNIVQGFNPKVIATNGYCILFKIPSYTMVYN